MTTRLLFVLLTALILSACAGNRRLGRSEPIVDMKGVDVAAYQQDLAECRVYASEVGVGARASEGAVVGAVVGGAIGAVVGNSDTAERGAGVGAVTGGLSGTGRGLEERNRMIRNCLLGRGYRVLN